MSADVRVVGDIDFAGIEALAARYGIELVAVAAGAEIPGSYWGAPEAGLIRERLYVRADTPLHSVLHELGHYVCMSAERRATLHTDAGGTDDEECAVCFLQLSLADALTGFGPERCADDMDAWGYSFREGSVRAWLAGDGREARAWLAEQGLIDARDRPTGRARGAGLTSYAEEQGAYAGQDRDRRYVVSLGVEL